AERGAAQAGESRAAVGVASENGVAGTIEGDVVDVVEIVASNVRGEQRPAAIGFEADQVAVVGLGIADRSMPSAGSSYEAAVGGGSGDVGAAVARNRDASDAAEVVAGFGRIEIELLLAGGIDFRN